MKQGLDAVWKDPAAKVDLVGLLKGYVASLDHHLLLILNSVNELIPIAGGAASKGEKVYNYLIWEENQLQQQKSNANLWQKLVENRGWKGERFRKDMEITSKSISAIKGLVNRLLEVRGECVGYRQHIFQFKVPAQSDS